ncbi:MAG: tetratricopeptide repeat protein, partial [Bacteroidales bacterium]|nr:tetratricopeptide repeat protein [Bacteroidales bacterium]
MTKQNGDKELSRSLLAALLLLMALFTPGPVAKAQINTDRMMTIGRNALYFDDYILSIQYFNQVIRSKPYMAEPYLYRAVAKLSLEDYLSAEEDCSAALERNPFVVRAYYFRSYARMHQKKYEAAIEDCVQGLEFNPEHKGLMLNKGISRMYAGQHPEARKDLDELVRKDPNFLYAYMSRGQLS